MKFAKALIIGAVLSAGAAFAEEERTDPNAIAGRADADHRQEHRHHR